MTGKPSPWPHNSLRPDIQHTFRGFEWSDAWYRRYGHTHTNGSAEGYGPDLPVANVGGNVSTRHTCEIGDGLSMTCLLMRCGPATPSQVTKAARSRRGKEPQHADDLRQQARLTVNPTIWLSANVGVEDVQSPGYSQSFDADFSSARSERLRSSIRRWSPCRGWRYSEVRSDRSVRPIIAGYCRCVLLVYSHSRLLFC
jgi:hypothetical protein